MCRDLLPGAASRVQDFDTTQVAIELHDPQLAESDVERAKKRRQPRERDLIGEIGTEPEDDLVAGLERRRAPNRDVLRAVVTPSADEALPSTPFARPIH